MLGGSLLRANAIMQQESVCICALVMSQANVLISKHRHHDMAFACRCYLSQARFSVQASRHTSRKLYANAFNRIVGQVRADTPLFETGAQHISQGMLRPCYAQVRARSQHFMLWRSRVGGIQVSRVGGGRLMATWLVDRGGWFNESMLGISAGQCGGRSGWLGAVGIQNDVCLNVAPATRPLRGCKLILRFSPGWGLGLGGATGSLLVGGCG